MSASEITRMDKTSNLQPSIQTLTLFAGDKIPKANGCERDDNKVDSLQRAPAFDVLEDDGGQRHKDEAAEQGEEYRGEDAHLGLADLPLLLTRVRKQCPSREGEDRCDSD